MTYLLDSHALLWLVEMPHLLSPRVRELAADGSSDFVLSVATPWELAIKETNGKLDSRGILDRFEHIASRAGYTMLPTTVSQAIRSGRLPLHHKDPFDRLLAAQALDLCIPLISRDAIFDLYGVQRVWN
jgi:PIN domain nuclease of toxin-antitoxin system